MGEAALATDQLIPIKRIARSLGLTKETVARMAKRGDFPKPFPLGIRKHMFLRSAVEKWWAERLGGQDGTPFPLAAPVPEDNR